MATTTIEMNAEAGAIECYQGRMQELTDAITSHSLRFRRIALGRLGNAADAEDAVQDALLSAWTHVDQFKGRAKMSTWLTTIVINSARMKLRRRPQQVQIALDEPCGEQNLSPADMVSDTRPDPEEVYHERQIAETLAHATLRLSPTLRTTFRLRDVDGLSIRETAQLLGVPTGTVKARLARARRRLKQVIQKSFRERVKRSTYGRQQECTKIEGVADVVR
ncbi:MAG: sigma-70 family RNA polymerase sigma factor [Terriglobales bacterium]|jgi:RNA polymerase sigma-70 factor (ECF subfamily)